MKPRRTINESTFRKTQFHQCGDCQKRHQPGGSVSCHGQIRCANAPMRPGSLVLLCQDGTATVGCRKGSMGSIDFEAPGAVMSVFVTSNLRGQSLVDGEHLIEPIPCTHTGRLYINN